MVAGLDALVLAVWSVEVSVFRRMFLLHRYVLLRGMGLAETPIVSMPFGNSPVPNIDNSTPQNVGSKYAYSDNVPHNYDYHDQIVTELFPISPDKTPPTTPLNSPGAPSTKQSNGDYYYNGVSSPVPMHQLG